MAVGRDALLVQVAHHRLAAHGAGPVLPAHGLLGHVLRRDGLERLEDLDLLVADRVLGQAGGRLHRHHAQQLQQVVLHHVAQRAGVVVELAARFHAKLLGDGDLHVLHPLAAPQRLEQRVAEADRHQVLHRLLAQIVVDPVDLVFGEVLRHGRVDRIGRMQVMPERLLQNDADIGMIEPGARELLADGHKDMRPGGEIAHHHLGRALQHLGRQRVEVLGHAGVRLHIADARKEGGPGFGRRMLKARTHALFQRADVVFGGKGMTAGGKNTGVGMKQARAVCIEQRRQQLAPRQVPGAAEQHHVEIGHAHPVLLVLANVSAAQGPSGARGVPGTPARVTLLSAAVRRISSGQFS